MEYQAGNNESDHTGVETEQKIALEDEPQNDEIASHVAEKESAIRQACDLRDFDALVAYATSEGGFLNDDVRRLACKSSSMQFFSNY